ncbi:MAG: aspartyl/asparaginyl beta-hydroxylase domain-containing protein [Gammaproteobacteria bacterium]
MASEPGSSASAVVREAMAALQRGDLRGAMAGLDAAIREHPVDPELRLHRAMVQRAAGNLPAALAELDAALAIDPHFFLALLSKGAVLERLGEQGAAALVYRDAIRIAPAGASLPPALEAPLARARAVVEEDGRQLAAFLQDQTAALRGSGTSAEMARFDECLQILAGRKRVYHAEPVQLHVPRLPAIPFFERSFFPWLPRLEAATAMIRAELEALMAEGMPGFAPYIAYPPGAPLNQWETLNHNRDWSSLWLWRDGERQEEAIARCPGTAALLAELPMADQPGFAPTALFSALAPHTQIPPHSGSTNARLLVHLPLILPGPARFRVGNETREWRMGEAWCFDDSIEHEAWNEADRTRVILIFDIWNPLLDERERDLLSALMRARTAWYAPNKKASP